MHCTISDTWGGGGFSFIRHHLHGPLNAGKKHLLVAVTACQMVWHGRKTKPTRDNVNQMQDSSCVLYKKKCKNKIIRGIQPAMQALSQRKHFLSLSLTFSVVNGFAFAILKGVIVGG